MKKKDKKIQNSIEMKKPPMKKGETKKIIKRLIGDIWRENKLKLIFVIIGVALHSFLTAYAVSKLSDVIDNITGETSLSVLGNSILKMAIMVFSAVIIMLIYNQVVVKIAQKTLKDFRDKMFIKMQRLPIRYFDTHKHGDIMSYYTNDCDTLGRMISDSLPSIVSSVCTIITMFCFMCFFSLPLTAIVIVMVIIMMLVTGKIGGMSRKYFVALQRSVAETNGYVEEMVNGQKVIKVFNHENQAKEGFDKLNEKTCYNATTASIYANIFMPVMAQMGNLQYVILAVVGSIFAMNGILGMTVGALVAFLMYSKSFTHAFSQSSNQINSIIMALAGAQRIYELLDEEPEIDNGYVRLVNAKVVNGEIIETHEQTNTWAWKHPHSADGTVTYKLLEGDVVLDNVDFGYTDEKMVLKDVSLHAKPGQKFAFVGATGAGKTTITNLINRFYDVQDGKIRYDGININKIAKDDLRRSLGVVLQDVNLFTGTVMENIRYGKLDATDDECIAAAKLANAHNFIMMLPEGYNTVLEGDGSGLSQGQRQLISIARAAVSNPPVMILDEATSSIDTRTESLVQRGMDALMDGRTTFVIAHRLSTVRNSDMIIVLDHGQIIESGSHDELLKQKGKYYQLYTGKFELE